MEITNSTNGCRGTRYEYIFNRTGKGKYFGRAIYDDLAVILKDIQTAHIADKPTVDEVSEVDHFKQLILANHQSLSKVQTA